MSPGLSTMPINMAVSSCGACGLEAGSMWSHPFWDQTGIGGEAPLYRCPVQRFPNCWTWRSSSFSPRGLPRVDH